MKEAWVRSLGWKGPLEKDMATHSSILAWKIPWTEEPGALQPHGSYLYFLLSPQISPGIILNSVLLQQAPYRDKDEKTE